jgi:hypothetical protein
MDHIAGCPECSDVALVSSLLRVSEEPRDLEIDLSKAQRIWWRVEMHKRRRDADRALLPITIGELSACLLGGVVLIGLAATHTIPLSEGLEAAGLRLLSDPLIIFSGAVAVVLTAGTGFLSIALVLGSGTAKT